jgi:acyl-[acyl-carrier-protein]-phospholipid O-acyltransferase/long-chain-fatty-acid--[acyl-carrier-protein] ligase
MVLRVPLDMKAGEQTIFDALIAARETYGDKEILEDQDRKPLTYTGLIRAAFVLGRKIAAMTELEERVGILLPSSMGVVVTYYGLHAHGRVPVMLNFTSGEANIKAAIKAAGVKKILTAKRFITQAKLDDLVEEIGNGRRDRLAGRCAQDDRHSGQAVRPDGRTDAQTVPVKTEPSSPGVVLFTSGSFGAPKGVVLSQWNLVANCRQVAQHIDLDPNWVMFNPLPTFHCFGLTGGVLLPILRRD